MAHGAADYTQFPGFGGGEDNGFNFGDIGSLLKGFGSIYGAYGGMKALDLSKDQFNFSKDLALTNLSNQANLTNSELTDRQNRRNRNAPNNGGDPLSTADYLSQFGVSGTLAGNAQQPAPLPSQNVQPTGGGYPTNTGNLPNGFNFGRG